jgi:hypothetical protein
MIPSNQIHSFVARLVELFNEDLEGADAAQGWTGNFGIEFDDCDVAISVGAPVMGKLPTPHEVDHQGLIIGGPTYYARASRSDFMALLTGELDAVSAIVQKKLVLTGDLMPVIARMKYRGLLDRWLKRAQLEIRQWDLENS